MYDVSGHVGRLTFHQLFQHEGIGLFDEGLIKMRIIGGFAARVGPSVGHQVTLTHEIFGAQVASEGAVDRTIVFLVGPSVEHQVALQGERLPAFGTNVGTIPWVSLHVLDKVFFCCERRCTNYTVVLGALHMLPYVPFQMFLSGKRPVTVLTTVRRLTCMNTNMIC